MSKFKNWLINVDESKIIKRATFWNLIASLLNSFMSAVLLFFITWINGVDKAGMFSIASAFAYQCLSLGYFGVRNYHASDVKKDYTYKDYLNVRIISGIFMLILIVWCAFGHGYSTEKSLIVLTFCIFKCVDIIEDLMQGEMQRNGRLDIGCILQSIRYLISLIAFIILLYITKNVAISCIIITIMTTVMIFALNKPILSKYVNNKEKTNNKMTVKLFFACLPICIGNAINMYIANCPKYAIDSIMTDRYQTYYGILAMPVFTINLLSAVIYRPYVKLLGDSWQNKNYKLFFKYIFKQVLVILALTFAITLFGYIIGLTIIELIYGVKLHVYMSSFIILLFGGGLNAMSAYFAVVLTASRAQNKLFIGYAITFVAALLLGMPLVKLYGINGAAYLYAILNLVTLVLFTLFIFIRYKEDRKRRGKNG